MTVPIKGGRPLKFETVEGLQEQINAYFEDCEKNKRPLNVTSMAIWLDTSRETITDYEVKDGFSDTIKKAKMKIFAWKEEQLYRHSQVVGIIFDLKNNYSEYYKDKQEIEMNATVNRVAFDKDDDEL